MTSKTTSTTKATDRKAAAAKAVKTKGKAGASLAAYRAHVTRNELRVLNSEDRAEQEAALAAVTAIEKRMKAAKV
jgi:hypothetical protein